MALLFLRVYYHFPRGMLFSQILEAGADIAECMAPVDDRVTFPAIMSSLMAIRSLWSGLAR
jgi:hypothetical protein